MLSSGYLRCYCLNKSISRMPNPKISGVDAELILNAVREQCEAHKAGIKALQIHIDASANVTGVQLDEIQKHLKRLNGSVTDLYKKHEERGAVVEEFHAIKEEFHRRTKKMDWVKRNWWVIALLFMGMIVVVVIILDAVGLRGLFNAVKEVKDVL